MRAKLFGRKRNKFENMNAPRAPSRSPQGGEGVASGRVRGFLCDILKSMIQ